MNLDTFLKSQTFKTGVFVLVVLFVLMLVFKLGVLHGYKAAISPDSYGVNKHRNVGNMYLGHQGAFRKDTFGHYSDKINLIKTKRLSDSTEKGNESDEELIVE